MMLNSQMKKSIIALTIAISFSTHSISGLAEGTYHNDYRTTSKLDLKPSYYNKVKLTDDALALDFLALNKQRYGLENVYRTLKLAKIKSSLIGNHYHFQQYLNDIKVDKAEIIVSINKDNRITRVFNNTYPVVKNITKTSKKLMGKDLAEEKVWDFLQVSGKLQATPKSKLIYLNIGSNFKLAYKVNMIVTQPFGDWEFYLDAITGNVINAKRIDLPISKNANSESHFGKWKAFAKKKYHKNYQSVLSLVQSENKKNDVSQSNKADATALVFDPDPVTTLNNDTLEDTSSATDFDAAYFTRTLLDVTLNNGIYSLEGPWVTIADFDSPTTAPSTTTDGNWNAKRGDNSFNDAMTYFHIDQNQRYMQSLGFVDATGIQFASIRVDTDGANGDDNSYYSPGANQLAFGHGCVDDNEDVDVILHEYGHAINTSINSNWSGGDTGAMGEGFGDYWAASYSYSTPNGRIVHPEWAFSWDGHNACWNGRLLNQTSFRYDSSQTYGAHVVIAGVAGDELWSTPLAESLLELLDAGVSRSDVDQIILEAQFGLGSGIKMPDMAASIVSTAVELFPAGSHASVFDRNFKLMEILGESLSIDVVNVVVAGSNTVVDPGETVTLNIALKNSGGTTLTGVSSTLSSSTNGVTIGTANGVYSDMNASESQTNTSPYEFSVPGDHVCGVDLNFSLVTNYTDGSAQTSNIDFSIPVGLGSDVSQTSSPALAIPDNNTTGVTDELTLSGAISGSSISVDMNITHTYRGDMTLTLTSPAGTSVIVQTSSNDSAADIIGIYPTTLAPANSLSAFDNEDHNGVWSLKLVDSGAVDLGTLNSWSVISTSPAICNANSAPDALVVNSVIDATEGDNVIIDATPSNDSNGDPITFSWTQTSGSTVTINNPTSAQANFDTPSVVVKETLIFEVTVSDDKGAFDTASVEVNVADINGNNAPIASVASNNIVATEGEVVNLDAGSSSDPDGDDITYSWVQTSGTSATLSGATSSILSISDLTVGELSFEVTVTDTAGATDTATVNVTVNAPNQAPTATIQMTATSVNEGANVSLNGSTSSDPDGDTLTYDWSQLSGPSVTLNSATSATSTFTAPSVSSSIQLSFRLTVTDPSGETSSADVTITVNDIPESGGGSGGGSSGGGSIPLFSVLGLLLIRRLRKG